MPQLARRRPGLAQPPERYTPSTRIGLAVSCAGFSTSALVVTAFGTPGADAGFMDLPFVAMILTIAYLPRRITPRPSWSRAEIPPTPAAGLYVSAGAATLLGVAVADTTGEPVWSAVGGAVAALGAVGALVMPRQRD